MCVYGTHYRNLFRYQIVIQHSKWRWSELWGISFMCIFTIINTEHNKRWNTCYKVVLDIKATSFSVTSKVVNYQPLLYLNINTKHKDTL